MESSYSLLELNTRIRQVLSLNFAQSLWIRCELAAAKSSRGHYYLDLIEKQEQGGEILAQASAALWSGDFARLHKQYGEALSAVLQPGVQVLLQIEVQYHERYGLKYIVKDLDLRYTEGLLARQRRDILRRLESEGLLHLNKTREPGPVIRRIAVISAATAAGYQDFLQHLLQNPYGYTFETRLFEAPMQGEQSGNAIAAQIRAIQGDDFRPDCIAIIRGGGSRIDLSAFDHYEMGKAIAESRLPVLSGIGHDIDESIADLVAYRACKTPTAVAEFIFRHNAAFEQRIENSFQSIVYLTRKIFAREQLAMDNKRDNLSLLARVFVSKAAHDKDHEQNRLRLLLAQPMKAAGQFLGQYPKRIQIQVGHALEQEEIRCAIRANNLPLYAGQMLLRARDLCTRQTVAYRQSLQAELRQAGQFIQAAEALVLALDPRQVLQKGYSITLRGNEALRDSSQAEAGDLLTTLLASGSIQSIVKQTDHA